MVVNHRVTPSPKQPVLLKITKMAAQGEGEAHAEKSSSVMILICPICFCGRCSLGFWVQDSKNGRKLGNMHVISWCDPAEREAGGS